MKTNGNDYANPISADVLEKHRQGHFNNVGEPNPFGLTKREHFAAMAMQGWISATEFGNVSMSESENLPIVAAKWSVAYADELIKALNKGGDNA